MALPKKVLKQEIFNYIEKGDVQEVEKILQRYPDLVNKPALNELTPIMFAVSFGHINMVKLLAKYGATIKTQIPQHNPLNYIRLGQQNDYSIAEYLLKQQADPNTPGIFQKALM